ncbi:hypothetical protein CTAYLR_003034 [Chrysophaeum taylorii]|uniref:Triosephosphate isomerase n=1 Tax=Chrysophaeum taylorii TaxID=2483200 RepID=A0AAD7XJG5_9STRA|nr:hypothetical protein CTAYLR_003034 [Chrysophaeum taylorii]
MLVLIAASAVAVEVPMLRKTLVAGNWKMNPGSLAEATELASSLAAHEARDVIVFPPFPFAHAVTSVLGGDKVGSQDICHLDTKGAFTGEVSGPMIAALGIKTVLVGHSERRVFFGDDDDVVAAKVKQTLALDDVTCMLCIGETRDERDQGITVDICNVQLSKALAGIDAALMDRVVIAYEPVWAIGTGLVCEPEVAQDTHAAIRTCLAAIYDEDIAANVRVLYGGSVSPASVDDIMSMPDIDGVLVGGASLVPDSFFRIIRFEDPKATAIAEEGVKNIVQPVSA